ncbi:aromatic compound dioxygenase, partial [Thozetella sp. PMI_491]
SLVLALSSLCLVSSHPEGSTKEQLEHEIIERSLQHVEARQALDGCYNSMAAQELRARAVERRASMAAKLRAERGLVDTVIGHPKRDPVALAKWSQVSHNRSALDISFRTPETTIFGSNATCALVPETIVGPYFVTGELLRSDISEDQPGVRTHLDIQFVDIATCKPVPNMLIDIWHANSTGVYSGVVGSGGLNTTFMRGVQVSDRDGAVQFSTAFPGHYMGRTTHIHVVAQTNGTVLPNGTYTGGKAKHIGQLYFDDSLVLAVEKHWPYHTNTIPLVSSTEDFLTQDEATSQYDPYVDYVQLSHNLADGLMAWITIAVNMSADHSASLQAASHYYEGGG